MEAKILHYNELPMITFRWTRANDLKLEQVLPEALYSGYGHIKSGEKHLKGMDGLNLNQWLGLYHGANREELGLVLSDAKVRHYIESDTAGETVRLSYDLTGGDAALLEVNVIKVKAGETLNVVLDYEGDKGTRLVSTLNLIDVAEGGTLNLSKINLLPDTVRHIEQRYAKVSEGGTVNYLSVELGGRETIVNYVTDLAGEEAKGYLKSIYIGNGERILDLSHQMNHFGEKCRSDMEIRGALDDKAKKYFRGTLDFKKGSAQSEGREVETVVLLNKEVRSFAIPLLLCGEHDVIGNHAASAGQIDEEKLFYLMSRGFSFEESRRIIVESAFRPIIDLIPDEDRREKVQGRIDAMLKKVSPGGL